ncbi:MAG: PAS domain-containing protein [Pararhodobacter sp.]
MTDALTDTSSSRKPGDILHMPFSPRTGESDYPVVRAVQRHWDDLRGNRLCPSRAEIDPKPLAHCLDVMFIAELVAPSVARVRLSGQELADLLGMEPRGMPLSVFFTGPARDDLALALAQVAQGARAVLPLRSDAGLGQPAIEGLLAMLPLTDTEGRITRILGVLETHGPAGRTPRRFRLSAPMRSAVEQPPARPAPGAKPRLQVIHGGKV